MEELAKKTHFANDNVQPNLVENILNYLKLSIKTH